MCVNGSVNVFDAERDIVGVDDPVSDGDAVRLSLTWDDGETDCVRSALNERDWLALRCVVGDTLFVRVTESVADGVRRSDTEADRSDVCDVELVAVVDADTEEENERVTLRDTVTVRERETSSDGVSDRLRLSVG